MIIRCRKCGKVCGDLKNRVAIEGYIRDEWGIKCEECGEENYFRKERKEEIDELL